MPGTDGATGDGDADRLRQLAERQPVRREHVALNALSIDAASQTARAAKLPRERRRAAGADAGVRNFAAACGIDG